MQVYLIYVLYQQSSPAVTERLVSEHTWPRVLQCSVSKQTTAAQGAEQDLVR